MGGILAQLFLKEKKRNIIQIEEQKSTGWDTLLHTTQTVVLEFFRIVLGANSIFYLPFSKTGSNNSFFSLLSGSSWEKEVGKESQILGTAGKWVSIKESSEGIGAWHCKTVWSLFLHSKGTFTKWVDVQGFYSTIVLCGSSYK